MVQFGLIVKNSNSCTRPGVPEISTVAIPNTDVHIIDLDPQVCANNFHDEEHGETVQPVHRGW